MAIVRPFRAYRPPPALVSDVASPPYDVISTAEARLLVQDKPMSFLHVARPEVDLPVGIDEHDDAVYAMGTTNLQRLVSEGVFVQDQEPHLYLYEQTMGQHRQVGVVGCASVAEYLSELIKKHEKTRADKEDDRTRHIQELGAHDEPVFLTYRKDPRIDALVASSIEGSPIYAFTTPDGVGHRLWVLNRQTSQELEEMFQQFVTCMYVADGHHRSAAAARVHQASRGDGREHDIFMAVVFPDDQMKIMPYNRVVRDLDRRSTADLLSALGNVLELEAAVDGDAATPKVPGTFGIYVSGKWYVGKAPQDLERAKDPVKSLDCSIAQDLILGPIFGVVDPRRDKHVDFVGGIRGYRELEKRVDSGEMTLALHLYPTQISQLFAVSDVGLLMPPKSTWFEPKLRSGLFVHVF